MSSIAEGYCWTRTAERQASRLRSAYLKAVLRQEVAYFDLNITSTAEIIASVSSDSLVIQEVISEKVRPSVIVYEILLHSNIGQFDFTRGNKNVGAGVSDEYVKFLWGICCVVNITMEASNCWVSICYNISFSWFDLRKGFDEVIEKDEGGV